MVDRYDRELQMFCEGPREPSIRRLKVLRETARRRRNEPRYIGLVFEKSSGEYAVKEGMLLEAQRPDLYRQELVGVPRFRTLRVA